MALADLLLGKKTYYDYKTPNTSFLVVAKELRDRNVSNYKFPLTIYDKDLIGVDPYSEGLSDEIKSKIIKETSINIWYFLREVIKIPAPAMNVPYKLHRGNLAMTFCQWLNIDTSIELPRQHYKTYSAICFYVWVMMYVAKNYTMVFSHKSYDDSTENLKKLKDIINPANKCLPSYMYGTLSDNNKDIKNTEKLVLIKPNNTIKTIGPANNKEGADKAGSMGDMELCILF